MGKIPKNRLQEALEKLRHLVFTCPVCGRTLYGSDVKVRDMDDENVWAYISCPHGYDWALWKLLKNGNPQRIPTLEEELAKFK